jgi:hypothetical protein
MIPKIHKLKGLFKKIGLEYPVQYVLDKTGIISYASLRVILHRINKTGWKIINKFGKVKRIK